MIVKVWLLVPVIQSSSLFLWANSPQVDLFLLNFYRCLPFHVFKIYTSHYTRFLVFNMFPPVTLSAFDFWNCWKAWLVKHGSHREDKCWNLWSANINPGLVPLFPISMEDSCPIQDTILKKYFVKNNVKNWKYKNHGWAPLSTRKPQPQKRKLWTTQLELSHCQS